MPCPAAHAEILQMSPNQVQALRQKLQDIDWGLTAGRFPRDAVEELKVAVDDLRSRVWAIMTAYSSSEGVATLQRFRLRRGAQNLAGLIAELRADPRMWHEREVDSVKHTAEEFLKLVADHPAS